MIRTKACPLEFCHHFHQPQQTPFMGLSQGCPGLAATQERTVRPAWGRGRGRAENGYAESPGPSGLTYDMTSSLQDQEPCRADAAGIVSSHTWLDLTSTFALALNLQLICSFLHSTATKYHFSLSLLPALATLGCKAQLQAHISLQPPFCDFQ